ncbi:hypothetical protein H8356DRAFT_1427110 [Neocallimastix lanati (nom. inval.)]|nr:hypothetical protein H8356DRAFT_1427110 [Neocallimastix sp. JGI-2020a]
MIWTVFPEVTYYRCNESLIKECYFPLTFTWVEQGKNEKNLTFLLLSELYDYTIKKFIISALFKDISGYRHSCDKETMTDFYYEITESSHLIKLLVEHSIEKGIKLIIDENDIEKVISEEYSHCKLNNISEINSKFIILIYFKGRTMEEINNKRDNHKTLLTYEYKQGNNEEFKKLIHYGDELTDCCWKQEFCFFDVTCIAITYLVENDML